MTFYDVLFILLTDLTYEFVQMLCYRTYYDGISIFAYPIYMIFYIITGV
jgi:hypothetical protein